MRTLGSLFLVGGLLVSAVSDAKDLTNRLGVGFINQFSVESLNAIAVRYYPNNTLGLAGALGVDTQKDNSKFGFQVKLYKIIFLEDNMNFYMGTAAALISTETASANSSGFELTGFAGAEFFFTGLESLGFSFEAGIGVASISNQVRFRTMGDFPTRAGVIFYF